MWDVFWGHISIFCRAVFVCDEYTGATGMCTDTVLTHAQLLAAMDIQMYIHTDRHQ